MPQAEPTRSQPPLYDSGPLDQLSLVTLRRWNGGRRDQRDDGAKNGEAHGAGPGTVRGSLRPAEANSPTRRLDQFDGVEQMIDDGDQLIVEKNSEPIEMGRH